jgi:hypothetical protein
MISSSINAEEGRSDCPSSCLSFIIRSRLVKKSFESHSMVFSMMAKLDKSYFRDWADTFAATHK